MIENKNTRMDIPKSNDSGLEDSKLDNSKLEDLKITTIKEVFGGLPLDKRRKLAYEFLDLA
jgi:hypothetical protein